MTCPSPYRLNINIRRAFYCFIGWISKLNLNSIRWTWAMPTGHEDTVRFMRKITHNLHLFRRNRNRLLHAYSTEGWYGMRERINGVKHLKETTNLWYYMPFVSQSRAHCTYSSLHWELKHTLAQRKRFKSMIENKTISISNHNHVFVFLIRWNSIMYVNRCANQNTYAITHKQNRLQNKTELSILNVKMLISFGKHNKTASEVVDTNVKKGNEIKKQMEKKITTGKFIWLIHLLTKCFPNVCVHTECLVMFCWAIVAQNVMMDFIGLIHGKRKTIEK